MIALMTNPTISSLATALQEISSAQSYEPVVILQSQGMKAPLWFIHPGVGEALVFLNFAKHVMDRPVYALRARGFNEGETYFRDVDDAVATYHDAIRKKQPQWPYAIAGYSYGSMLAFEVAKILEKTGDTVSFVGSFNLPPHIKTHMRQLNWTECILHLSYFLSLITETHSQQLASSLESAPKEEVLANALTNASSRRMAELALTPVALVKRANLAYALQSMAVSYESTDSVAAMDIFYCTPLAVVAASRQQWLEDHLSEWSDFGRSEPKFREVSREHYTMLSPDHVSTFKEILNGALRARGI